MIHFAMQWQFFRISDLSVKNRKKVSKGKQVGTEDAVKHNKLPYLLFVFFLRCECYHLMSHWCSLFQSKIFLELPVHDIKKISISDEGIQKAHIRSSLMTFMLTETDGWHLSSTFGKVSKSCIVARQSGGLILKTRTTYFLI